MLWLLKRYKTDNIFFCLIIKTLHIEAHYYDSILITYYINLVKSVWPSPLGTYRKACSCEGLSNLSFPIENGGFLTRDLVPNNILSVCWLLYYFASIGRKSVKSFCLQLFSSFYIIIWRSEQATLKYCYCDIADKVF